MPRSTPTLALLAVFATAATFGALGPAHRAELFALATFMLLTWFARGTGAALGSRRGEARRTMD